MMTRKKKNRLYRRRQSRHQSRLLRRSLATNRLFNCAAREIMSALFCFNNIKFIYRAGGRHTHARAQVIIRRRLCVSARLPDDKGGVCEHGTAS